jgi:hypothetical protein
MEEIPVASVRIGADDSAVGDPAIVTGQPALVPGGVLQLPGLDTETTRCVGRWLDHLARGPKINGLWPDRRNLFSIAEKHGAPSHSGSPVAAPL